MKYKVGDKVKIKSLEWYNSLEKDSDGDVYLEECDNYIVSGMVDFLGKTAIIERIYSKGYDINLDNGNSCWTDEMFENETMEEYTELINIANNSKNNVCTTIDYEQRRYEIAKEVIANMCVSMEIGQHANSKGVDIMAVSKLSIDIADELIRQLKQ